MNSNRSTAIIHDLNVFALPVQVASSEPGSRLRVNGHCRYCGGTEVDGTCEWYVCIEKISGLSWSMCSCCGELLVTGTPCLAYMTAWDDASESRHADRSTLDLVAA